MVETHNILMYAIIGALVLLCLILFIVCLNKYCACCADCCQNKASKRLAANVPQCCNATDHYEHDSEHLCSPRDCSSNHTSQITSPNSARSEHTGCIATAESAKLIWTPGSTCGKECSGNATSHLNGNLAGRKTRSAPNSARGGPPPPTRNGTQARENGLSGANRNRYEKPLPAYPRTLFPEQEAPFFGFRYLRPLDGPQTPSTQGYHRPAGRDPRQRYTWHHSQFSEWYV